MLRVLAIAWHDLREGDEAAGVKKLAVGEIEEFYRELTPQLRAFEDVEVEDPLTKEKSTKYGVPEDHPLWTSTLGFLPGQKAPIARQGTIKPLSQQLANWARSGLPK